MTLNIKNPEADRLARAIAEATGESLTDAVVGALRERLERETGRREPAILLDEIRRIQERIARLPILDRRTPEAIIGYDDLGLPR